MSKTIQALLVERRSVIQEQRRERDQIAREILQYQIDDIDREIAYRHESAS